MTVMIDLAIEAEAWSGLAGLDAIVQRGVDAAAAETRFDAAEGAEVSLLFCDDAAIRVLNRDWRAQDKPTNVLSFPAATALSGPPGTPRLLGDIAIAYETARREADEEGRPFEAHLTHLVVHGFLHLLGHDHEDPDEATRMETAERRVMARLGFADPYAGSDPVLAGTP